MSTKYKFLPAPKDYPGNVYSWGNRVLEHHLVWWQKTGEVVPDGHVLHHKNENGMDNRIENLELLKRGAHSSHHVKKHKDTVVVTCAWCDSKISRSGRDVSAKRGAGQERFFCSSSHAAKFGHSIRKGT